MKKLFVLGLAVVLTAIGVFSVFTNDSNIEETITKFKQMDDERVESVEIVKVYNDEDGDVYVTYKTFDDNGEWLSYGDVSLNYAENSVEC